ncbi:MAG: DUF262 domain-containing protein [Hyphomicrobiaceae bacterium]|nr:DUF262 domain-containing protein [Hyphomicrobiaceae bacterium]
MPAAPSGPSRPPIVVTVETIERFFSTTRPLQLPWFQRAYAWHDEHAARLLSDIITAMQAERRNYLLGHILLAGTDEAPRFFLIDGHQRAITLTILIALLRDRAPTEQDKNRLSALISPSATAGESGDAPAYRIITQPSIASVFLRYVQQVDATKNDALDGDEILTEIETRIIENRQRLAQLLDNHLESDVAAWQRLVGFLLERCFIIIETVDDENEAWTILSVEESTGIPFHSTERLKISLIAAMPGNEQQDAARRWHAWQAKIGDHALQRVVHHVRALQVGVRSNQPLEQELIRRLRLNNSGADFLDRLMEPNVARYAAIRDKKIGGGATQQQTAKAITYMQWLEHDFWMAPALRWLELHGADAPDTAEFFTRLERLAWFQRMTSNDPVQHERRFIRLAKEMSGKVELEALGALSIEPKMRREMRENLLSRTFYDKRYSRLVLRRICAELGADPGQIDGVNVSVEHILPRRPEANSPWRKGFPRDSGKQLANRLGNLALLPFDKNQEIGVRRYEEKRPVLQASAYPISLDAAVSDLWTPDVINKRTERLARLLFERWQLPFGD